MGHIKRYHLSDAKVVVADDEVIELANGQIGPLFELRIKNKLEAKTLASLRDTLLPKLISGELRLPAAALEDLACLRAPHRQAAQAGVPAAGSPSISSQSSTTAGTGGVR